MKVIPGPGSQVPRPGSLGGTQLRDEFEAYMLSFGDCRLLYLPRLTETTTSTDRSRNARTLTYDATVASRYTVQGSGVGVTFDGTDDEADTPDVANHSFGDGSTDYPFSIVAVINATNTAEIKSILTKYDETTASTKREWELAVTDTEALLFRLWDESAGARIGRTSAAAGVTAGAVHMIAATYDGARVSGGVKLYQDATKIDNADSASGTYTAMENTASLTRLGFEQGASAGQTFFQGDMYCVALYAVELSIDQLWEMKKAINSYYGLSL